MKRYTTQDCYSDGRPARTDKGLPLNEVLRITDWSNEEVEQISEMQVGSKLDFGGITVERTENV